MVVTIIEYDGQTIDRRTDQLSLFDTGVEAFLNGRNVLAGDVTTGDFTLEFEVALFVGAHRSCHIDIQSTGQKSVCEIHHLDASQTFVLIIQLDSPP